MALRFSALLAAAWAAAAPIAVKAADVNYTIEPVMSGGALNAVKVTVAFRGESDGETSFELPDQWGGEAQLFKAISELDVKGATIADGSSPHVKSLTHKPRAKITVSYLLKQEKGGDPDAAADDNYRVIIRPGYFHFLGWAAFAYPAFDERATRAALRVRGLPAGWSFASDTEHLASKGALTLLALRESVTIGGDFTVLTPSNGKAPGLRVALRGKKWSFEAQAFADRVATVISEERAFWGDPDEPFLVTLLPLTSPEQGWTSIGGTGLTDAFAMFSTEDAQSSGLTYVLAHEAMHTWIPRRLGRLGEAEAEDYWLSEGFTDFYTYRLLARSGLWTPQDFAGMFNEMLSAYAFSPERAAPNTRIGKAYWTDPKVQKLPYQRGMLFALMVDRNIARASGGAKDFDDLVLDMRKGFGDGSNPPFAAASFREKARALGVDVDALVERHIVRGEPILLDPDVFAPCGGVETLKTPPFDRGFDAEKTNANGGVVAGVKRRQSAYAAGLRDGMKILRRESGKTGDPTQALAYRVQDGSAERTIRYMPHGEGVYDLQRLALRADLKDEALQACKNALGGVN